MARCATLGVIVCFSLAGLAFGQELPKPGPEHQKLKELEGNWDAVMEMEGQKSKATATYKSVCGGMWIQSDFQGEILGMKFQGHGMDGYDQGKKYVGVWCDSMSSGLMNSEGNFDPQTKLLVMTGESTGPDGKLQKYKLTTDHKDKDHMTFKMYMVQPDGKDKLSFTIEYTRRK